MGGGFSLTAPDVEPALLCHLFYNGGRLAVRRRFRYLLREARFGCIPGQQQGEQDEQNLFYFKSPSL